MTATLPLTTEDLLRRRVLGESRAAAAARLQADRAEQALREAIRDRDHWRARALKAEAWAASLGRTEE
jgi:hypothetical protein